MGEKGEGILSKLFLEFFGVFTPVTGQGKIPFNLSEGLQFFEKLEGLFFFFS
jgi:hypothetical protein